MCSICSYLEDWHRYHTRFEVTCMFLHLWPNGYDQVQNLSISKPSCAQGKTTRVTLEQRDTHVHACSISCSFLEYMINDQGCSQRDGSETYDRLTSEALVASSVKQLRATGLPTGNCKSLLSVLLLSALSPMANAMELSPKTSPLVVLLLTMLVIAFGLIFWLGLRVHRLQGSLNMKPTLLEVMKVLHDNLKLKDIQGEEPEESDDDEMEESPNARLQRYQNAEDMSQVSDNDEWCKIHHGPRYDDDGIEHELGEMHTALQARLHRLESDWNEAEVRNDLEAMRQLELQIMEVSALLPRNP